MSLARAQNRLELPETLQTQLHEFRGRVWSIKMLEALGAGAAGVFFAYLAMFALDRLADTPVWLRAGLFGLAMVGGVLIPRALYRWVWRQRHWEQLARLLIRKHPRVGDQLLGIIELVHSDSEQARSRTLCEAAIRQVAEDARHRDFRDAVPNPRHRLWLWLAAVPAATAVVLLLLVPAAASNAWARLLAPWKDTPRYTFAALEPLPARLVVAHGEPITVTAALAPKSSWRPAQGVVQLGDQPPVAARLRDGRYTFTLPAQIAPGWLKVRIGDSLQRVRVEPTLRPELSSVVADVRLPDYLGIAGTQRKDVRGGAITLVKGSLAGFAATATRTLQKALVDGQQRLPRGSTVSNPPVLVDGSRTLEFRWQDAFGLAGKEPFTLTINGRDDEPPSLACENLPRQRVVLDSELLAFTVRVQDDFGIKRVGLEWQGVESPEVKTPAKGERVLAPGENKETLEVAGTFSARSQGIEPQPIRLRVYAEDFLPGRPRVYSPTYLLYVLNAEQHALWLTDQLSKWQRQSLEVRDRELQLFETNKQLRALSRDELNQPETRKSLEKQSAAERANGRRLSALVLNGEDLVRQAMRNPEFGVGHLEKWAEMLQVLKDISGSRMPTVADLLTKAAQAPGGGQPSDAKGTPTRMAGQIRAGGSGKPSESKNVGKAPQGVVPQVVDRESSQLSPEKDDGKPGQPKTKKPSTPRLGLPQTTLAGAKSKPDDKPSPPEQDVEEAVVKQQDLLAEFEKISDELNRILANLEGSTFVKRLKAASRTQSVIASKVSDEVGETFGKEFSRRFEMPSVKASTILAKASEQETKESQTVSVIMDDMQAYAERRPLQAFRTVLDEMKQQDVIGSIRQIGDDLNGQSGTSIAQCEFWSDTLDRWAEDLVDPSASGECPGGKSRSSLPPSVVLEVLQILEAEVNLRDETRVAEQAKAALTSQEHDKQAHVLSTTQHTVEGRVEAVTQRIRELPDGPTEFAPEIALLTRVGDVMGEASGILARPETGAPAVAAETEAIELLLQSKRINPKGGGGGGSSPGFGSGGTTQDSALALLGRGANEKEVRQDHGIAQSTGESGPALPEEFRAGLDEYFNRLERPAGGQ